MRRVRRDRRSFVIDLARAVLRRFAGEIADRDEVVAERGYEVISLQAHQFVLRKPASQR